MANTIKTVITYTLDGSTREFNIPFEYLARKFVSVTLIGVDRQTLTLNTDYRFASRTVISLNRAWGSADGYKTIELRRYTSATERLVDFTDGSILRAYDLNIAQVQTMHVAEEARDLTADTISVNNDGQLDARGRRIVNVADPVDEYDALNLRTVRAWNDSALNSATRAEDARNSSWLYSQNSLTYRNNTYEYMMGAQEARDSSWTYSQDALTYRNNAHEYMVGAQDAATEALSHRNTAWQYQDWAKGYKESAESSAASATAQADRAKAEADKLGNVNGLAGAISAVTSDNTVVFKGNTVGRGYYFANQSGDVVYSLSVDNGKLSLGSNSQLTNGTPRIVLPGAYLEADRLISTGGILKLYSGNAEFNMTLSGDTLVWNRANVSTVNLNGITMINGGAFTATTVKATDGLSIGNSAWVGTDGNVTGPIWTNGSLKGEMLTKCTYADLNTKVSESTAAGKYLVDVAHGAQTANPLWDKQGAFEVQAGHSLCGWLTTTGDGSIRYTNWISRCLMKRVESSGWIQCGNIS